MSELVWRRLVDLRIAFSVALAAALKGMDSAPLSRTWGAIAVLGFWQIGMFLGRETGFGVTEALRSAGRAEWYAFAGHGVASRGRSARDRLRSASP